MRPLCDWAARKSPCLTRSSSKNTRPRKKKIFIRRQSGCCNRNLHRSDDVMEKPFTMPKLGATMTEGTVLRWLYQTGAWVEKGEPIVEIMTDKVNIEVETPISGRLVKVLANDGDVLQVGTPMAILSDDT